MDGPNNPTLSAKIKALQRCKAFDFLAYRKSNLKFGRQIGTYK